MINGNNGNMMEVNKKSIRRIMMEIIGKGIKRKNGNPPVRKETRKETRKIMTRNMINGKNGSMTKSNQIKSNKKIMRRTMMEMIEKGIKRKNKNPPVRKKTRKMNGNVWNVKRNVIHWKRYLNTYTKMSAEDGYVVMNT